MPEVFPARICECGSVHDRPEAGCPECGSVIAREAGDAVFVSDLDAIRSQERQRVREEALKGGGCGALEAAADAILSETGVAPLVALEAAHNALAAAFAKLAALDSLEERG